MKVLWFAVTPSLYSDNQIQHNGGGWIASLEKLIRKEPDIELGIAFEHADGIPVVKDGVKYFPINNSFSKSKRLQQKFNFKIEEKTIIPACLKIIDDFKPDIIQVFGSEWCFGLVAQHVKIPVVIHMQGSIPPIYNALYPPGYSLVDHLFFYKYRLKKIFKIFNYDTFFSNRAEREIRILKSCKYFLGRTDWDKNLTQLYSPDSKYFHCSEAIRDIFFEDSIWKPHERSRIIIVSTLSTPLYKGTDVVLKTAKLLKENTRYDFEWRLVGIKDISYHEWKTHIKACDVHVKTLSTLSAEQLSKELINADMYIHPSYIDNSPNSICEAQILGLPVISTNVGGISSLIQHHKNGLLSPANDPFTIASYIKLLVCDKEAASKLGKNARITAIQRHDSQKIIKDLMQIYNKIVYDEKKN